MNPLAILRTIGLVEGITTLALFFVAMPLKYGFGFSQAAAVTGMVHGMALRLSFICWPSCRRCGGGTGG